MITEIVKSNRSFQNRVEDVDETWKINCNYIYKISCSYFTSNIKFVAKIWNNLFYPVLISNHEIHVYRKKIDVIEMNFFLVELKMLTRH